MHTAAHMLKSEDNLKELVLSYHVGPRDWTQVIRLSTNTLNCWAILSALNAAFFAMTFYSPLSMDLSFVHAHFTITVLLILVLLSLLFYCYYKPGLELVILLPSSSKYWDYTSGIVGLALTVRGKV